MNSFSHKMLTILKFIRIHHTLFALPFLLVGILEYTWKPDLILMAYAIIGFTGIRGFAITYSDIIDLDYDKVNPRSRDRPLVKGDLTLREAWISSLTLLLIYIIAICLIDHVVPLVAWIPPLLISIYPYLKRYVPISHFILGSILAIAPWGGYIVYSMKLEPGPWDLSLAIFFWVAGFDIIYHIQDIEVARKYGIKNIPAMYGVRNSIVISAVFYVASIILLFLNWIRYGVALTYLLGVTAVAIILFYQIKTLSNEVNIDNIRKCFNINLYIGPIIFLTYLVDIMLNTLYFNSI